MYTIEVWCIFFPLYFFFPWQEVLPGFSLCILFSVSWCHYDFTILFQKSLGKAALSPTLPQLAVLFFSLWKTESGFGPAPCLHIWFWVISSALSPLLVPAPGVPLRTGPVQPHTHSLPSGPFSVLSTLPLGSTSLPSPVSPSPGCPTCLGHLSSSRSLPLLHWVAQLGRAAVQVDRTALLPGRSPAAQDLSSPSHLPHWCLKCLHLANPLVGLSWWLRR